MSKTKFLIKWTVHNGHDIWLAEKVDGTVWYAIDDGPFVETPDWKTAKKESVEKVEGLENG